MSRKLGLGEYYGRCIRRRRVHGFLFTENRFPSGRVIADHQHLYPHFTLVLEGGFVENYRDLSLNCSAGSILIVPKGQTHSDEIGPEGAHSLSVEISSAIDSRIGKESAVLRSPRVLRDAALSRLMAQSFAEFLDQETGSEFALECLAMQLLSSILRSAKRQADGRSESGPAWLREAVTKIHERFMEPVSLAALASEVRIHRAHLARAFKARYGCTVGQYATKLRIDHAQERLAETQDSIARIAIEAGFCDQAHFTRVFRKAVGMTPSTYRSDATHVQDTTYRQALNRMVG